MTDAPKSPRPAMLLARLLLPVLRGRSTKREMARMAAVQPELMRVVYSRLPDEEAAARIGDLVRGNRPAAKATLRHIREAMQFAPGYDIDRAYRILQAAIKGTAPEPVAAENKELFERERELGWLPLSDAFDRLCAAAPELSQIKAQAEDLASSPSRFGIVRDAERDTLVVPGGVLARTAGLVGPQSRHRDPLIRSSLAATVVARYQTAVLCGTTDRSAWDPSPTSGRIVSSGSFGHV